MRRTALLFFGLLTFIFALTAQPTLAAFPIVTSATVLEEVTRDIGGPHVETFNIGPHDQDMHFVIVRPSHINLLMKARGLAHFGLQGEAWLPPLIESSGNQTLMPGSPGDCDVSVGIKILEKPERVSREMGNVHPAGNPHVWLDPLNMIIIGRNIRDFLIRQMPEHRADFEKNFQDYAERWKTLTLNWAKRFEAIKPVRVIDYHVSWSYFYARFKIEHVGTIEPKPGIKPSGAHLARIIADGKRHGVDFVMAEPFFPQRDIAMVANELGVPTLIIQQIPGGTIPRMQDVFERIVSFAENVKKGAK